jgi:hypothetical protein
MYVPPFSFVYRSALHFVFHGGLRSGHMALREGSELYQDQVSKSHWIEGDSRILGKALCCAPGPHSGTYEFGVISTFHQGFYRTAWEQLPQCKASQREGDATSTVF